MAFKVTSSFGFASSAWAEYSFSGATLGTYASPTGSAATFSTTTPTILLTQTVTPTGQAATFSAGSVIAYHGTQTTDSSFAENAFASMPFAGSRKQPLISKMKNKKLTIRKLSLPQKPSPHTHGNYCRCIPHS